MNFITDGFSKAFDLIFSFDPEFLFIVFNSLGMAAISTLLAAIVGLPAALIIGLLRFPGRKVLQTILETFMSLPTVLVGLLVFAVISRKGPLGEFDLLYTRTAVIIGQTLLIIPLITALSASSLSSLDPLIFRALKGMGASRKQAFEVMLLTARTGLTAAFIASFSRVFAEVGVAMMLGGNIKGYTRTITTVITLETGKGDFSLGIALGIVLLLVALLINLSLSFLRVRNDN